MSNDSAEDVLVGSADEDAVVNETAANDVLVGSADQSADELAVVSDVSLDEGIVGSVDITESVDEISVVSNELSAELVGRLVDDVETLDSGLMGDVMAEGVSLAVADEVFVSPDVVGSTVAKMSDDADVLAGASGVEDEDIVVSTLRDDVAVLEGNMVDVMRIVVDSAVENPGTLVDADEVLADAGAADDVVLVTSVVDVELELAAAELDDGTDAADEIAAAALEDVADTADELLEVLEDRVLLDDVVSGALPLQ
ncbi:hypothetical protein HDU86_006461 [Geranomyces michiganensis]|nr:hypothetical protein HDU86_006461 [Geranomyces michiganensis]